MFDWDQKAKEDQPSKNWEEDSSRQGTACAKVERVQWELTAGQCGRGRVAGGCDREDWRPSHLGLSSRVGGLGFPPKCGEQLHSFTGGRHKPFPFLKKYRWLLGGGWVEGGRSGSVQ